MYKKAFWNWYNSGGLQSENETAKERKKTQRQLTVMVTSLFAWPMTGAENYGHNSCHLLPSSFNLRSIEIHIRLNDINLIDVDFRSLKKNPGFIEKNLHDLSKCRNQEYGKLGFLFIANIN